MKDLKQEIVTSEYAFIQVLNYISNNGHSYGTSKKSALPCPCHTGSTKGSNSFSWREKDGIYQGKCFSCDLQGNAIDLYMLYNGMDLNDKEQFKVALKEVAELCGIQVPEYEKRPEVTLKFKNTKVKDEVEAEPVEQTEQDDLQQDDPVKEADTEQAKPVVEAKDKEKEKSIKDIINEAHEHVTETDYFHKRGLSDETVRAYKLGYSQQCIKSGFDNGPGAIIPYPGEDYYFTRLIAPKGKLKCLKLPGKTPLFNAKCIKDSNIIWVTEGQFDCLSIIELGGVAISTDSANTHNTLLNYIKTNNIKEKVFIIAFDNDDVGNKQAQKLIHSINDLGLHAIRYVPSEGKDINDMLVNCVDKLADDIGTAQEEAERLLLTPPPVPKDYTDAKGRIDTGALVLYTTATNYMYRKGNRLYRYNRETGIYDVLSDSDIHQYYYEVARADGTTKDISNTKCDAFTKTLFQIVPYHVDTEDELRYIACENGIIDSATNELLPFDSKYKLDCKFNGKFDPNYADWEEKFNNSKFKAFLKDILIDDDVIDTMQEMWGNMLCPHSNKIQQIFIYLGDGSNGKSSLFDIQEALLASKENVCGISLGAFSEDRFILSMAQGKRINIVRDDRLVKDVGGCFKSVITGEPVTTQEKNKNHTRQSFNMAWFYGTNSLPNTADKTHGYYRRNCIIPFRVKFGTEAEVKKSKADKVKVPGIVNAIIEEEMDIIFMWAYWGLQRLIKQNWVLSPNNASAEAMEEYKEDTNSAYSFYKSVVIEEPGADIMANTLYEIYTDWCSDNHYQPMNGTNFGKQIKSFGVKWKKTNRGNKYLGISVEFVPVHDGIIPFPPKRNNRSNKNYNF